MYVEKYRYENLQHGYFERVGKYDIPKLVGSERADIPELVGFNYARSVKNRANKGIHFFLDDYQFVRLWNNPCTYLNLLKDFKCVLSPDFSLYIDFPKAMQIYNHYRKHWLAAFWESEGIEVIPTICWGDEDSYEWCFDGEPVGGTVAVSSVGILNSKEKIKHFIMGYEEMIIRLAPQNIIFFGNAPKECGGNIFHVDPFYKKLRSISN